MEHARVIPSLLAIAFVLSTPSAAPCARQTAPPAPVLVAPASGAAAVQPITLRWNPIVDPDGPIGSYCWEISTTSNFGSVIASGFNNLAIRRSRWRPTAQVSGLANGTYFWRVKGAQDVGGVIGFIDSPFSAVRKLHRHGPRPGPGVPDDHRARRRRAVPSGRVLQHHLERGARAHHYLLEADEDAGFQLPDQPVRRSAGDLRHALRGRLGQRDPERLLPRARGLGGQTSGAGRRRRSRCTSPTPRPCRRCSRRSHPSEVRRCRSPSSSTGPTRRTRRSPATTSTIDDEPNFLGAVGVLLVQGVSRSDYLVVPDPLVEGINHFPPGTYFWRVRAVAGNAFGPWSAGQRFVVTGTPATPAGLGLFWIVTDPGSVQGGNPTAARLALTGPAPAGGALIQLASDFPGVEIAPSVLIPPGATDAVVAPITTHPVHGASFGDVRAAWGTQWQESSIGLWPILWGGSLSDESVIGGSTVTGTVTLLGPAPAGGVEVTLVSSNTALARPPASVLVPAGATGASFAITTAAVSQPTRIVFDFGTAFEGYGAPQSWLLLTPPASPAPPPDRLVGHAHAEHRPRRRHRHRHRAAHRARARGRRADPAGREHGRHRGRAPPA
jgi:hypothetical protein